ncbi:hypothetical protein [Erythrobacter sp.]|uniref:hypothetical protein n=1 Tax=Sphingomonadales TaxID=204457 RepID=UPI0032650C61
MRGQFFCKSCGSTLTEQIDVLSLKDPSVPQPDWADQEPMCGQGKAYKSLEPFERSYDPAKPALLEFSPQYWLNIDDIEETTKFTSKSGRLSGCCGLGGCDGPNILCKSCGAEVGTMKSDCWTPLVFIPDKRNTEFKREGK